MWWHNQGNKIVGYYLVICALKINIIPLLISTLISFSDPTSSTVSVKIINTIIMIIILRVYVITYIYMIYISFGRYTYFPFSYHH